MYWHHIGINYDKEGKKQVYINGLEFNSHWIFKSRIPVKFNEFMEKKELPCTFDFWVDLGLHLKSWTYAPLWSLAHHIKRM